MATATPKPLLSSKTFELLAAYPDIIMVRKGEAAVAADGSIAFTITHWSDYLLSDRELTGAVKRLNKRWHLSPGRNRKKSAEIKKRSVRPKKSV